MAEFLYAGKKMRIRFLFIVFFLILGLSHCASYDFSRRTVQQGNLLPQSKIDRLKIGMSKNSVAILMGTSLLSPVFNNNRWDYAYSIRKGSSKTLVRNLRLYFKNDTLVKIEHYP
ncbi:outer membrane protein assembly factor BamE [Legionella israelensis]|nr:outer membrane protein assembly factor BamE [Legionella israelensis]QDP71722.1 outer membrane protein assembly factor BamE [Legionella israelensis]